MLWPRRFQQKRQTLNGVRCFYALAHPHISRMCVARPCQGHLGGNTPSSTPSAKNLHKPRVGGTSAFRTSRPTPPSGIGGGEGAGCVGSGGKSPGSATKKRRALGSIPHENYIGESSPAHALAASATWSAAANPSAGGVNAAVEAEGAERSARRRRAETERADNDRGCRDADTVVDKRGGGRAGVVTTSEQRFRREAVAENDGITGHDGGWEFGRVPHAGTDARQWTRPPGKAGNGGDQWLTQGDADVLIEGCSQWLTQEETSGEMRMSPDVTVNNNQPTVQAGDDDDRRGDDDRYRMSRHGHTRGDGNQFMTRGSQREGHRAQNAGKGRDVNGRAGDLEGFQVTGSGDDGLMRREVEGTSDNEVRGGCTDLR